MIYKDAEENAVKMLLTPQNSSNPLFWGRDLKFVIDGKLIEPIGIEIPKEFDFFNAWCGKDPANAKIYYKI